MLLATFTDIARFRSDDPDALVSASLACPVCLHSDGISRDATLEGHDPSVRCFCPECSAGWRVYLAPQQALRMGLLLSRH